MKLIFAGTPPFAACALEALVDAGHEVVLVLTQPDRPAGRGLKTQVSAVKALAESRRLEVAQPVTLRDAALVEKLAALQPDAMIVAAYGLILPQPVLALPRLGCLNIHASLLPRWRGAAPIQRAILAGDVETGVTIMQMDAGLDTGPIRLARAIPIAADDTAQTLHDKLAEAGARLMLQVLADMPAARPQDEALATYAAKITRSEARLDWREPAVALERRVRAFNPVPGAYTDLAGQPLKVWRAAAAPGTMAGAPGEVVRADAAGIVVSCGSGVLRITELQRAGGKRLPAAAFLAGAPLAPGTRLDG